MLELLLGKNFSKIDLDDEFQFPSNLQPEEIE